MSNETVSKRMIMPQAIFCPRCASPIKLIPMRDIDVQTKIIEQGYDEGARGMCGCGVVTLVCIMHLPKSPTFSIFMDLFNRHEGAGRGVNQ